MGRGEAQHEKERENQKKFDFKGLKTPGVIQLRKGRKESDQILPRQKRGGLQGNRVDLSKRKFPQSAKEKRKWNLMRKTERISV